MVEIKSWKRYKIRARCIERSASTPWPHKHCNISRRSRFAICQVMRFSRLTLVMQNNMSTQLKPVGDWVDQAFNAIFFHSDDALAIKSFEDHFDPGLLVR